jgi:uncharacterized protein (DUF2235 family)
MTRRIALCFDGTWNTVKDHTNVSRIHEAIRVLPDTADDPQIKYYDTGVGTRWYDRILGGSTGAGLSENIIQGYAWLTDNYRDDDEIFLFGFSRGAFTARSVSGLIGRCGIPRRPDVDDHRERRRQIERIAQAAHKLYRSSAKANAASKEFLETRSRAVRVKFIGVWDTVGALGVPLVNLNVLERFHDTALGRHVDFAFHALAIDEERKDFEATLWTENPGKAVMQQRWFPGSHANVGGGYRKDKLPSLALAWIAAQARDCGLKLSDEVLRLEGSEFRSPIRDSYGEFLGGIYKRVKQGVRFRRPIGKSLAESVDECAYQKWQADDLYRPANLPSVAAPAFAHVVPPSP